VFLLFIKQCFEFWYCHCSYILGVKFSEKKFY
jgi:hypothetical protein